MWGGKKQKTNKLFSEFMHQQARTQQMQFGLLREFQEKSTVRPQKLEPLRYVKQIGKETSSIEGSVLAYQLLLTIRFFHYFLTIHLIYLNTQRINGNIKT